MKGLMPGVSAGIWYEVNMRMTSSVNKKIKYRKTKRMVAAALLAAMVSMGVVSQVVAITSYAASKEDKDYSFSSLTWDTGDDVMMAYWDQSEDDQRYKVQLYKDSVSPENKVGAAVTVTNKDYYDFTKLVLNEGIGNYIFTVTGLKENDTQESTIAYVNWESYHNMEDKYIGEHPKTIYGTYSVDKMQMINKVDPVTVKALESAGLSADSAAKVNVLKTYDANTVLSNLAKSGNTLATAGNTFAKNPGEVVKAAAEQKATEKTAGNGWLKLKDADWYHFTNGVMDIGWYTDPATGQKYYFNSDGTMKTGYMYLDGQNYVFGADGKLQA